MKKKVAILQSNYIPWRGYFDIIRSVDLFIFLDNVQYTKHDWRNRNKIKTPRGAEWITIPVGEGQNRLICEVSLPDKRWKKKHWSTILANYAKAKHFSLYKSFFESIYLNSDIDNLSELNQLIIRRIANEILSYTTEFADSRRFNTTGKKDERLIELLRAVGATEYVSGPAAKSYINEQRFADEGIKLTWVDYSNYKEYRQLFPPFISEVSIVDLIFNEGAAAKDFIGSAVQ